MKNKAYTRNANIVLPLAVAEGTESGDIVLIGDQGLIGIAVTDRYNEDDYDADSVTAPPQGLADGEASVEIPGISLAVILTVAGSPAVGDPVYRVAADGTYSATAASNDFIGYYLGNNVVGLMNMTPAPA